jgi:hypothetical protein
MQKYKYSKLLKKLRKEFALPSEKAAAEYILQFWTAFDPQIVNLAKQDLVLTKTKTKLNQVVTPKS